VHAADRAQRVAHRDQAEPVAAGDQRRLKAAARRLSRSIAGPGEGGHGPDRAGAEIFAAARVALEEIDKLFVEGDKFSPSTMQ
jgi:hypothetical protein